MFGVPRFKEFSERDFMTLRVIESHRGSDDEQNQGISRTTRIKPRRTGTAFGNRSLKRRQVGERLQYTDFESFIGAI